MKDSDKKILIVLAAILILVATWFLVVSPTRDDIKSLESENATLRARLDDLIAKEQMKDQLEKETAEAKARFAAELTKYPADLNQESTVMFMKGVEQQNEFIYDSIVLPEEEQFYVIGASNGDETEIQNEADAEAATDDSYVASECAYSVDYIGTYDGIKDYMDYIANYKYRMNISSIDVKLDEETGLYTGNLVTKAYSVAGPDRKPDTVDVTVPEGKENIFIGAGVNVGGAGGAFDANNGQDIVANHELMILLDNAANDTTDGIIVATDSRDDSTFVTSSDNEVVELKITVTEENDKKYVEYAIGAKKNKAEFTGDALTVYVNSAARVDDNDKNGVNVVISNGTTIPVVFKVVDDDTASPRFNIKTREGSVKVY